MTTGELVGVAGGRASVAEIGFGTVLRPNIESGWNHPQQSLSNCRYRLCVGTATEMLEELR
ncbi:hypothetical protein [Mycolicibacterium pallens]|uniref:Uncharacterized protein n=1 Tax=Mycolicibacterium pallens TaxID=370524 RepID=A0ABX8VC20_9MYCO|nr:hypothetical protein [Mycolicibacterium pallens]QYL14628.1 hypothetical protein K0O64_15570 [Mycolicibacterium pallens]